MVKAYVYDLMYRLWAPWDSVGVRQPLVDLLTNHEIGPLHYPRSIDLGCGTGANVVYLAQEGFDSWGVDFSEIAIRKAADRARLAGVEPTFAPGDLTAQSIDGVDGPFDLILDFGTLDDLKGDARRAMASTVTRLSRPGSLFLEYCFYGAQDELPWVSRIASKLTHIAPIAPGELDELFGQDWDVEPFAEYPDWRIATFLLTRR